MAALFALTTAFTLLTAVATPRAQAAPAGTGTLTTKAVGGDDVADGLHPFQASLQLTTRGATRKERHKCGGSLLDAQHVLTAGHCASQIGTRFDQHPVGDWRVLVGATVLNSNQGVERGIARVKVHPRFDASLFNRGLEMGHDVAVLTLDQPVEGIAPVVPGSRLGGV